MNSEAALTETWIVWIFNPGATIIRSTSCCESDSRYTKHYQQLWRYHNHISGLMPLTNSYLTTILVHMLWHSGELHILASLALLLWLINQLNGSQDHIATRPETSQLIGGIEWRGLSGESANMADILDMSENINRYLPFLSQHSCTQFTMGCVWQCTCYLLHSDSFMLEHIYTYFNSYVSHMS